MHNNLTICIPSNRNFTDAKPSIDSAINYCKSTDANLVVSDNSEDIEKKKILKRLNLPFVNCYFDNPKIAIENWLYASNKSKSSLTMILSDDDLIFNIKKEKYDYKNLKRNNIIGIKPIISLWNESVGIYKNNTFNLNEEDPLERVLNYKEKCLRDNTSMYSFFDTNILNNLLTIFLYHPTRGGYTDWAFMLAMASSGKILHDASNLLIYKNNNWFGNKQYIKKKKEDLFIKAGLGARGLLYSHLFRAVDSLILILRHNSPISRNLLVITAKIIFLKYIKLFFDFFLINRKYFLEHEKKEIEKININYSAEKLLDISLDVIKSFNANLMAKYLLFYSKSTNNEWGEIK